MVGENVEVGVYHITQAMKMAKEQELDLVKFHRKLIRQFVKLLIIKVLIAKRRREKRLLRQRRLKQLLKKSVLVQIQKSMT